MGTVPLFIYFFVSFTAAIVYQGLSVSGLLQLQSHHSGPSCSEGKRRQEEIEAKNRTIIMQT